MWLVGVVVRRYIDYLILFIPATITYVLGPPPSRGGDLELEGGVNVSL